MHPAGALLFIGLLAATDPTTKLTPIPYIESIEVHVNNIDVIVTDRSGHRVRGLQQGDFELRENNAPQAITNFSEFRGTDRAAVPTATERLTAPSTEARSEPQPRTFVLIFDQLSLHPAVAGALQRRANEMVEATMQPGDQLMVLTPMGRTKVALPFTSDKRAILKAIDGAMRDSAFRANTSLVSELMMYDRDVVYGGPSARFGAEAYSAVVGRRVRQTLGHLQAVVAALAEVPGKKAVIFVTQSAPAEPGREAFANLEDSTSGRPVTTSETTSTPLAPQWRTLQPYIDEIARTASSSM